MSYPDAYCVKCGKHTATTQKQTVLLQNSARALKGVCPDCTTEVYKILPKNKAFKKTTPRGSANQSQIKSNDPRKTVYPDSYCVKCGDHSAVVNPKLTQLDNGSRAMKGNCAKCGTETYRILGNQKLRKTTVKGAFESKAKGKKNATRDLAREQAFKEFQNRRIALSRRADSSGGISRKTSMALGLGVILGMVATVLAFNLMY